MEHPWDLRAKNASQYLKTILDLPIMAIIKQVDAFLESTYPGKGYRLIVSGGAAINRYFENSPYLKTTDYDLKLVAPTVSYIKAYTDETNKNLEEVHFEVVRTFGQELADYIYSIGDKLNEQLNLLFHAELRLVDEYGALLKINKPGTNLYNLEFKLQDTISGELYTDAIIDLFRVNLDNIASEDFTYDPVGCNKENPKSWSNYHYAQFSGFEGISNPILSTTGGIYYIPTFEVDGILYAGLGYLIWDTLRMIRNAEKRHLSKLNRYKEKFWAIISSLNDPKTYLSCYMMGGYINKCNQDHTSCGLPFDKCNIGDACYNKSDLVRRGQAAGYFPEVISGEFEEKLDDIGIQFMCENSKQINLLP